MNWAIALKTIGAVVHFRIAQKSPFFDQNVRKIMKTGQELRETLEKFHFHDILSRKWEKVPFTIKIAIIGRCGMEIWVSIWRLEQKKGGQSIRHQFYKQQANQLSTNHIRGKYVGVFPRAKRQKDQKEFSKTSKSNWYAILTLFCL